MKILCLHANTGSRFYRAVPQLKWMQSKGHEVQYVSGGEMKSQDIGELIDWCDLIVLQMVFPIGWIKEARDKGKKIIFECDDLLHKVPELHYSYKETQGLWNQIKWWWRIFWLFRYTDGLIVSCENLKKAYGFLAKRTLVFPNYLDIPHWLKDTKKNTTDRVRILWAGSTSHTGDLLWVKPIMDTILKRHPNVQFIYMGYGGVPTDDLYAKFVYGDDIFEGLPQDQRESILPAPPQIYPYILASVQADIAIAPLEENYFNAHKTQCKYLEYAINGIPGVYAGWFYKDVKTVKNCECALPGREAIVHTSDCGLPTGYAPTGIRAYTQSDWLDALELLIKDATLRGKIGENAKREVMAKCNFADHVEAWQGFVESIYDDTANPKSATASSDGTQEVRRLVE